MPLPPVKKNLKDLTSEGLVTLVKRLGQSPYRAGQLYRWLFKKGALSIGALTDVSKEFRDILEAGGYYIGCPRLVERRASIDGTVKLLFSLEDGEKIESVLIPGEKRLTLCVSTQTGCALGCRFCVTGRLGPGRNLTLSELAGQVHGADTVVREGFIRGRERITNVVLMGMGEPLLNYDGVLKFIGVLTDPKGMNFSSRKVTVSTAGIPPGIERLGKEAKVNLAVSLNATTDSQRRLLMPVNKKYPLKELIASLRRYPLEHGRYITIEYVLIKDVNDSIEDAWRLAALLSGIPCKINLIPFNPLPGSRFERPEVEKVETFKRVLAGARYNVLIRISRGSDIEAACGQLRAGALGKSNKNA
ncbi:MAG: 23S rRNA (adenine(2503)-C(2))-methyltransferase RlmN [Deltaproteobacteria bacterium]|nr:23S rRNA (adenine(2503)-C(2))-methyltransferase RlmN [Deltaproteobacteria bacterium]